MAGQSVPNIWNWLCWVQPLYLLQWNMNICLLNQGFPFSFPFGSTSHVTERGGDTFWPELWAVPPHAVSGAGSPQRPDVAFTRSRRDSQSPSLTPQSCHPQHITSSPLVPEFLIIKDMLLKKKLFPFKMYYLWKTNLCNSSLSESFLSDKGQRIPPKNICTFPYSFH